MGEKKGYGKHPIAIVPLHCDHFRAVRGKGSGERKEGQKRLMGGER